MKNRFVIINWSILLIAVVSFIMTLVGLIKDFPVLYDIGFDIVFLSFLWFFGVLIFNIIKKKGWKRIVASILSVIFLGGCIMIIMILYLVLPLKDPFAKDLVIPTDIPLSYPMNQRSAATVSGIGDNDLFLFEDFQPGLYRYDLYVKPLPKGVAYLKAFEITKGTPLSDRAIHTLREDSSMKIHNPTDSIVRFRHHNHFTIYEGDWGEPYAARFEVWFVPESGEPEYKLLEKNFVIEGWQR